MITTVNNIVLHNHAQSESELEIFRLSTDREYRKVGIASKLVAKIERVAAVLKCPRIKASTSSAQESALKFYARNNWTESLKTGHTGYFLHGIEIVTLHKTVPALADITGEHRQGEQQPQLATVRET